MKHCQRPAPRRPLRALAALSIGLLLAACGDAAPTGPSQADATTTFTATVAGVPWNGSAEAAVIRTDNIIALTGTELTSGNIAFAFLNAGPGTYSIPESVGLNFMYTDIVAGGRWEASATSETTGSGTGSVTITALTEERIAGTFSFRATRNGSVAGAGDLTVTNGVFDVPF